MTRTVVADGQEALEIIRRRSFDLVLLDVHMPHMDGLAVARALIATEPPERRPRLVALTADATEEQRRECRNAGMDDYVAKPFRIDALIATVNQIRRRPD
jgi:CheY-like chemotaxis protein